MSWRHLARRPAPAIRRKECAAYSSAAHRRGVPSPCIEISKTSMPTLARKMRPGSHARADFRFKPWKPLVGVQAVPHPIGLAATGNGAADIAMHGRRTRSNRSSSFRPGLSLPEAAIARGAAHPPDRARRSVEPPRKYLNGAASPPVFLQTTARRQTCRAAFS